MRIRCRNCGLQGHHTQHCPRYGPMYPEPGKDPGDYVELAEEIAHKVAADLVAEHEGHEPEDEVLP